MLSKKFWNKMRVGALTPDEINSTLLLRSWLIIPEAVLNVLVDEVISEEKKTTHLKLSFNDYIPDTWLKEIRAFCPDCCE
jgi:hypothetical protein